MSVLVDTTVHMFLTALLNYSPGLKFIHIVKSSYLCLQVKASMLYTCLDCNTCEEWEFFDLLKEMDRRYFLIQDFRWEFSMLDTEMCDMITEDQARYVLVWSARTAGGVGVSMALCYCSIKSTIQPP